jgi:hypothetical protein
MNCNLPIQYAYVDMLYLTNWEQTGFQECRIFGVCSLPGRALLFHCQLNNGAVYYRLPISAFYSRDKNIDYAKYPLQKLQPWDSPSLDLEVITYSWLQNQKVECIKLDSIYGTYVTTLDWSGPGTTAEVAHEHKCLHLIKLENGQYALQPNNYLLWHEKSNVLIDGSHSQLRENQPYPSVES